MTKHDYENNPRVGEIIKLITMNPGIHYTDVVNRLDLAHGVVSHYLSQLERMKTIRLRRYKKKTFLFPNYFPEDLDYLTIHLRRETAGRIMMFLLDSKQASFSDIRRTIGKSPSTISITLTQLVEMNLIKRKPGVIATYELTDRKFTFKALELMRAGTLSSLKERFADTFSYL